ncbi:hypothetical protein BH11PSE10_BH11PSE10_17150 [soil metagenome]
MRSLMGMVLGFASSAAAAQAQVQVQAAAVALPALADMPGALYALTSLIVCAAGLVLIWFAFMDATDEGFAVCWQVGGFGGPSQGWRLSMPLARLIAGLSLVALGVALGLAQSPAKDSADAKAQAARSPAASASAAASAASASANK